LNNDTFPEISIIELQILSVRPFSAPKYFFHSKAVIYYFWLNTKANDIVEKSSIR